MASSNSNILYTGKGDSGKTSLICGKMSKSDIKAFTIGALDTLHAELIGTHNIALENYTIRDLIETVMNINSFLASGDEKYDLTPEDTNMLERKIETYKPKKIVRKFVVMTEPYDEGFYRLNKCRTMARETERMVVTCGGTPNIIAWLNRLSSLFYTYMLNYAEKNGLEIIYRNH